MGSDSKVNAKQETFCQEYLKDLNATQACIRAGYSAKNADVIGPELLGKSWVKARIQELMDKRANRTELTADKVLRDIEELRLKCNQGVPVLDREGKPTGEWKFEAHVALKASELQGKHLKLFTDKIEHSGKVTLDSVSDEDLDKKIAELTDKNKAK